MKTKSTCIIFLLTFIQLSFIYGQSAYSTDPNGMMIYNSNGSTPIDNSALVEVRSSTKGMLPPRMTTTQINNVNSPAIGLMIYDTDLKCLKTYNGLVWECTGADVVASTPLSSSFAFRSITDNTSYSEALAADNDGNTISVGSFYGAVTFGKTGNSMTLTSLGDIDGFIAKHDKDGNLIWATQIGGPTDDEEILDIAMDNNGNFAVVGFLRYSVSFYSTNGGESLYSNNSYYSKLFVAKYNSSGVLLWYKVAGSSGNYDCYSRGVGFDSNGDIFITGRYRGTVSFDATTLSSVNNTEDIFVSKLAGLNGSFIWTKSAGGNSNSEGGFELVCDNANNVYVYGAYYGTGSFGEAPNNVSYTSRGKEDIFLAKYNSSGALLWVKTAGNTDTEGLGGIAYSSTTNSIYVTGAFVYTMSFGSGLGTNPLSSVSNNGYYNGFLAKYDLNGNVQWATKIGSSGSNNSYCNDVAIDESGNPFITGAIRYDGYFYSVNSANAHYLRGVEYDDPFIAKYSQSGSLLWSILAIDGRDDWVRGISVKNNTAYVFGNFSESINFGYQQLNSTGGTDLFIWRYKE